VASTERDPLSSRTADAPRSAAGSEHEETRADDGDALSPKTHEVRLALGIGPRGLGLELAGDAWLGPIWVTEIQTSLPGLTFPLDVSGGVSRFRHRRGRVERLVVEVPMEALAGHVATAAAGVLSPTRPRIAWRMVDGGVEFLLYAEEEPTSEGLGPAMLAFRWTVAAVEEHVVVTVSHARGAQLREPATRLAIAATRQALRAACPGRASGASFRLEHVAEQVARALFPLAGARAPYCEATRPVRIYPAGEVWRLEAERDGVTPTPHADAQRIRLAAEALQPVDHAWLERDEARARDRLLALLGRTPRWADALLRLAELDAFHAEDRAEIARAALEGAMSELPVGELAGNLFQRCMDPSAARAAWLTAAHLEAFAPLRAALLLRVASTLTGQAKHAQLEEAVATCPALVAGHWALLRCALEQASEPRVIRAATEHLEALSRGTHGRFTMLMRLGAVFASTPDLATSYFERALRYAPRSFEAQIGLGRALLALGKHGRGLDLLARARERMDAEGLPHDDLTCELADALAPYDRALAVLHLNRIPDTSVYAARARYLEATLRMQQGDDAAASQGFARMRELLRRSSTTTEGEARDEQLRWLRCAEDFEASRNPDAARLLRDLGAELRLVWGVRVDAALAPPEQASASAGAADGAVHSPPPPALELARAPELDSAAFDEAQLEERIATLTRMLQADPDADEVVDELSELLARAGRGLELLALLSARIEDAPADKRGRYLPKQREVLLRLEQEARGEGNHSVADLYRDAREALG
jgi:tetratricopeptide (TPR) repeat protein